MLTWQWCKSERDKCNNYRRVSDNSQSVAGNGEQAQNREESFRFQIPEFLWFVTIKIIGVARLSVKRVTHHAGS